MIKAAGIMLICGSKALFLKRADTGEWAFPGGHIEAGETAEQAAERETREEVGQVKYEGLALWTRRVAPKAMPLDVADDEVDFTTFSAKVRDEFVPALDAEHTGYAWADVSQPPEPLHPGVRVALDRLTMDELGVARAIAAGELVSPQQYGSFWLWKIRITGTGAAYRDSRNEYCWRPGDIYLNEEFLARCNGLPVIFVHPEKKPKLDSKEFNDRIVGTVFLPFVRGDEVWAVTKIYDADTIDVLRKEQFSTSPGVVFNGISGNQTLKTTDGSTLLIEGKPALLDHIALVPQGVWDRGGEPSGVDATGVDMADETTTADAAKLDAKLDSIMDALKGAHSRMDAMEMADKARKDAEEATKKREEDERADRARMDAARKDRFGARKDGESYKDWKARHDADEAAMCDALEKGGVEKDRARKDAKDCRMDAEKSEAEGGGESFKKWAEEEGNEKEHQDAARKDAEAAAEREREDRARHDAATAAENATLKDQLAALTATVKSMTADVPASERDALASAQARADGVAAMFGDRASAPQPGETSLAYRKRLLGKFQRHSERFKESRFDSLDANMLTPVEEMVYNDAVSAARKVDPNKVGLLIPIETRDAAGRTITRYNGDPMAWMQAFMTGAQVGRINRTPGRASA